MKHNVSAAIEPRFDEILDVKIKAACAMLLGAPDYRIKLILTSYGLKNNSGKANSGYFSIPQADFYIDCRCIAERGIKGDGTHRGFQDGVRAKSGFELDIIYDIVISAIAKIPDRRSDKKDPYLEPFVICFFCAWGVHRSAATKHIIGDKLKAAGYDVEVKQETWRL